MRQKLPRSIAACVLAFAAFWLARAGAAPTVTFEVNPPNPVAGQAVVLRDTSTAGATSWLWDFGDGTSATTAAPSHVWAGPGPYTVTLQEQDTTAQAMVQVSAATTLSLLASHPFEISIDAKDPNTGAASPAQAVAVGDRFGWFSFPGLTHDPGNVEVTVKVLEAPTFGHYWIFWSAMTSLQYTMTV
ncbi:MAG TPA: PKD domain-containing protein, partial [Thermoanaerobaculia bacterium]|nr:PKD domain-containing protein [Thermoanaerobaculia bacterium]